MKGYWAFSEVLSCVRHGIIAETHARGLTSIGVVEGSGLLLAAVYILDTCCQHYVYARSCVEENPRRAVKQDHGHAGAVLLAPCSSEVGSSSQVG